jgi:L,D-peptidoglycan transpeptidase YkuD (ErfK/YbiS/YcfS/YnhG family)
MKSARSRQPPTPVVSESASSALRRLGCRQLLLVTPEDTPADDKSSVLISCFEKTRRGVWRPARRLGTAPGFVGKNGVTGTKTEGDGCTPAGLFRLGYAFGIRKKPRTKMVYRQITKDSCWVDDALSPYYNQWAEGINGAGWKSAEHLIDYTENYAYAAVVEYNRENTVPGRGSAIFLHCGDGPTSGCVAVKEADMLKLLRWLNPSKLPGILIR